MYIFVDGTNHRPWNCFGLSEKTIHSMYIYPAVVTWQNLVASSSSLNPTPSLGLPPARLGIRILNSWLNRSVCPLVEFNSQHSSRCFVYSSGFCGCVRVDAGGHLGGAVLRNLSSVAVQVMANVEPFVQGDRSHLDRQPRSDGSHCHVQQAHSHQSR